LRVLGDGLAKYVQLFPLTQGFITAHHSFYSLEGREEGEGRREKGEGEGEGGGRREKEGEGGRGRGSWGRSSIQSASPELPFSAKRGVCRVRQTLINGSIVLTPFRLQGILPPPPPSEKRR
jgi:hypothetical protein